MIQRTDEWYAARLGKVTASRIADVMSTGAGRKNYMAELVCERLTGRREEGYTNAAMQWGIDNEPLARAMFELETGYSVREVGFIEHPTIHMSGASPDGIVMDGEHMIGLVEIKCPNTATHIDYLESKKIPGKYKLQMAWQLMVTRQTVCYFVSFDPRLPVRLSMGMGQYNLAEETAREIEDAVKTFLAETDEMERRLRCMDV
jgi:putative phage-type endonuclease